MQNWDIALEELNRLKEIIESKVYAFPSSLSLSLSLSRHVLIMTARFILPFSNPQNNIVVAEFQFTHESSAKQNMANALESLHIFQP